MTHIQKANLTQKIAKAIDSILDGFVGDIHCHWGESIALLMATAAVVVLEATIDLEHTLKKANVLK